MRKFFFQGKKNAEIFFSGQKKKSQLFFGREAFVVFLGIGLL